MKSSLLLNIFFIISAFTQAQIFDCVSIKYNVTINRELDSLQNYLVANCSQLPYDGKLKFFDDMDIAKSVTWQLFNKMTDQNTVESYDRYLIENDKEIFFPLLLSIEPRSRTYGSLLYYPQPYVRFPLEIGKSWEWKSEEIGVLYTPHHPEIIFFPTHRYYTIKAIYKVKRKIDWFYKKEGKHIECYEIEAIGKFLEETMTLIFYFSPKYGFVYVEFNPMSQSIAHDIYKKKLLEWEEKNKTMSIDEVGDTWYEFYNQPSIRHALPCFKRYKYIFEINDINKETH